MQNKANLLKQFEVYAYRVAYYLLNQDKAAAEAVKEALLELFNDEAFQCGDDIVRKQIIKRTVIRSSLRRVHW